MTIPPRTFWRGISTLTVVVVAAGCAHSSPGTPEPPVDRLIPAPPAEGVGRDPALLGHVLRGLDYLATGHPSAAVTELRLALVYDPDSPLLHERLAVAWASSGDLERARAVVNEGLTRAPKAPGLNYIAGDFSMTERRFDEAVQHYELAAVDDTLLGRVGPPLVDALAWSRGPAEERARVLAARAPGDAALAFGLAAALEDHGRLEAAVELYRRARKQRPADEGAALAEVRVASLGGRFAEAAEALIPLFAFYPDEAGFFVEVSRLYHRAHRPEADAYRDEALRATDGDPDGRLRVAAADLAEGERQRGFALLHETVERFPRHPEARVFLAEALLFAGDAASCVGVLAPLDGPAPALHRLRAECLLAAGGTEAAVAELEAAIRGGTPRDELATAAGLLARYAHDELQATSLRDTLVERLSTRVTPDDVLLAQAVTLDFFGHGEALTVLDKLVASGDEGVDLMLRWTDLASRHGKLDAALETLRRLLRRDPQSPVLLNALGFTLADAGRDLDEADVWLRRAHRLAPDQGFIMDSLGWLLYRKRDFAGAVRLLTTADGLTPGDPEILRHLGDGLEALGKTSEARRCFERARQRHPNAVLKQQLDKRLAGSYT